MNRSQLVDRIAIPVPTKGVDQVQRHTTERTSSTIEIAATMGEKFTAGAGFKSAVN
jgi:hypothetical protein